MMFLIYTQINVALCVQELYNLRSELHFNGNDPWILEGGTLRKVRAEFSDPIQRLTHFISRILEMPWRQACNLLELVAEVRDTAVIKLICYFLERQLAIGQQ